MPGMAEGAAHNLKPFGMLAPDSMRLEKGYRSWKSDLTSDYTMLESGLERWVKTDKEDFIGRSALMAEQQRGASRRFVAMVLDDPDGTESFGEAVYLSSIRSDEKDIGLVVSAGYSIGLVNPLLMALLTKRHLPMEILPSSRGIRTDASCPYY